jgi:hypothetical protein
MRDAVVLGNVVGSGTIAALDSYGLFSGAREVTKLWWAGRAGRR